MGQVSSTKAMLPCGCCIARSVKQYFNFALTNMTISTATSSPEESGAAPHESEQRLEPHFVILQHGSHGRVGDLAALAGQLQKRGYTYCRAERPRAWYTVFADYDELPVDRLVESPRVVFDSVVNHGFRTDAGVGPCATRLLAQLVPALSAFVAAHAPREGDRVRLTVVGHSMGGIILRAALPEIRRRLEPELLAKIEWHQFVSISTPHAGARRMNPVLLHGGRLLGAMGVAPSYRELLLMGDGGPLAGDLVGDDALEALAAFSSRRLYGAVSHDLLVAFETATLCVEGAEAVYGPNPRERAPRATQHLLSLVPLTPDKLPPKLAAADHRLPTAELTAASQGRSALSLEEAIALKLRRRMDFDVVGVACDEWYPGAHTSIVSKRIRPWGIMMDDCSHEVSAHIAGHAHEALPRLTEAHKAATPVDNLVPPDSRTKA